MTGLPPCGTPGGLWVGTCARPVVGGGAAPRPGGRGAGRGTPPLPLLCATGAPGGGGPPLGTGAPGPPGPPWGGAAPGGGPGGEPYKFFSRLVSADLDACCCCVPAEPAVLAVTCDAAAALFDSPSLSEPEESPPMRRFSICDMAACFVGCSGR